MNKQPEKTPLEAIISAEIEAEGPMSLARYMALCLTHPDHGYYSQGNVIGSDGDFITAPEISQMFGELIGLTLADFWVTSGRPEAFNLVECGPGRGTLMADLLRACTAVSGFRQAAQVHLIESARGMEDEQRKHVDAIWHTDLDSLPEGPLYLIANEFFDALPIRQFKCARGHCFERLVAISDGKLHLVDGPQLSDELARELLGDRITGTDEILEISPLSQDIMANICQRIHTHGGIALIIDYGAAKAVAGDSFQAVQRHRYANPFKAPGSQDLTAHVRFADLGAIAADHDLTCHGPISQGEFLTMLGIDLRAKQLMIGKPPQIRTDVASAVRRLTASDEMGELFKAIAITRDAAPKPAGF